MWPLLRTLVGVGGFLMLLGGVAAVFAGYEAITGLYIAGLGAAGIIIAVLERARYSGAEQPIEERRLERTDEVFVDPTTGQRTRVWVDPQSGERSYRPE